MKIFSIDPAIKNIGTCLYDSSTKKVLFCDKFSIFEGKFKSYQQNKTIDYLAPVFFNQESPLRKFIDASDVVVIEVQMKNKMNMIQIALGAYLHAIGKQYKFLAPVSVNTHFKIGKRYRVPIAGLKKTVDKRHYDMNKKDGIALITKRFPEIMRNISHDKKDDVADAIKLALYFDEAVVNKKRKATAVAKPKKKKLKK